MNEHAGAAFWNLVKVASEMKTSDFYYDLPEELIAQDPLEDRSSSRLLTLDKETGEICHDVFRTLKII